MKRILALLVAMLGGVAITVATEAPGNEPTARVIPQTTHAVVGVLLSSVRTNEPDNHVLLVTVRTERHLLGALTNEVFEAKYREFKIAAIPEGIGVCFANHTGSGIEWEAKTNLSYVCFLSQRTNTLSLLRLEPVETEAKIKGMFEEVEKKEPQPSVGR